MAKLWSTQLKNDPLHNIVAVFWRETYWVGQTAITNGHGWVRVFQLITQVARAVDRFLKFWAQEALGLKVIRYTLVIDDNMHFC